jgi:hypothetical protein
MRRQPELFHSILPEVFLGLDVILVFTTLIQNRRYIKPNNGYENWLQMKNLV